MGDRSEIRAKPSTPIVKDGGSKSEDGGVWVGGSVVEGWPCG